MGTRRIRGIPACDKLFTESSAAALARYVAPIKRVTITKRVNAIDWVRQERQIPHQRSKTR